VIKRPTRTKRDKRKLHALSSQTIELINQVSVLAGSRSFLDDCRAEAERSKLVRAVRENKPAALFDALLTGFHYQGISDAVARSYLRDHGSASWTSITMDLKSACACPHLGGFADVRGCRYDKISFTCSEPDLIAGCPLPRYRLRNGRLNQTAFSFYLFVRDVAGGNLITWIDRQLANPPSDQADQDRLVGPLRAVYGVSDKILTMTLSSLFIGMADERPSWFKAGIGMIAIDTLVHNFLHRTGILDQCSFPHAYGPLCYAPGGCADVIRKASAKIDARVFNRSFPKNFPRFVQHAIWRYCAADGLDVCNGNRIDDRFTCQNRPCRLYKECAKTPLKA